MIRSIGVKNLSKKTIQKINRMIEAVLAEPEFYDQDTFGKKEECGTICCAAGWAVWMNSRSLYAKLMSIQLSDLFSSVRWDIEALKALDLKVDDDYDTDILFGEADFWPSPFDEQYRIAKTPKARAKVFARRWKSFIKNDGVEEANPNW